MNEQQALETLVKGVQLAQQKGVYSLQDAAVIAQAVSVFVQAQQPAEQAIQAAEDVVMDEATQAEEK